jgi:amino acid adenylation domain-containing protein
MSGDGRTLRSGFLRSVAARPDSPALTVGGETVSFGELERQARAWASVIVDRLGGPARRVGVFAYRSRTAYAGTLAALFAGATYVPLNRTFPTERTRSMIRLADLDAIVVDARSASQLGAVLGGSERPPLLLLPDGGEPPSGCDAVSVVTGDALRAAPPLAELPDAARTAAAYLLFTSGSTGVPKGVPVTHGNVLHFIDVMVRRYGVTPDDRFSQTFDQTFDLSVFDLFVAWEVGAHVCVLQSLDLLAPSRFAKRHALTVWFSVPSVPALMRKKNLLKPGIFPTLRWSLFCGEPLPRETAEAWQAAAPESVVENLYGPTELTIACCVHRWDARRSPARCVNGIVPIGHPYEGLEAIVLDDALEAVAEGEAGELCMCGPQTVPGYWRDPERTAERFVELTGRPGSRFYRTGDLVRRLTDGEYVYLGRTDHQIQVLGHRVELGEIEAVLLGQTGVVQAIAEGWPREGGTAQGIVAFVSGAGIDTAGLLERGRAVLPDYMVPSRILVIDEMPLNPNGKVDRKQLVARLESESAG